MKQVVETIAVQTEPIPLPIEAPSPKKQTPGKLKPIDEKKANKSYEESIKKIREQVELERLEKEAVYRGREYKVKRIQRLYRLYIHNKREHEALLNQKATIVFSQKSEKLIISRSKGAFCSIWQERKRNK